MLSNSAEPWNSMPICCRSSFLPLIIHCYEILAAIEYFSIVWFKQANQAFHEYGFAAAAGADDQVAFAGVEFCADITQ